MSDLETLISRKVSSRARSDAAALPRPVSFSPVPRQAPGGKRFSLRGAVLYPAILGALALASHLVGGSRDETR